MSSKDRTRTCCVIKCVNINTPWKSEVKFYKFPQKHSLQRTRWVQAVRDNNGPWWRPDSGSLICGEHFVKGKPDDCPKNVDYAPSVFANMKKPEIKSRTVSVKEFAFEYIKYDALLEKPTKDNMKTDQRKLAYVKLSSALLIPVATVRSWEKRFREYYDYKMAEAAERQLGAEGVKPRWLLLLAKRLGPAPGDIGVATSGSRVAPGDKVPSGAGVTPGCEVSPGGVVEVLCAAARARGTLCSTALYNDVRRALRLSAACPINDLHAVW
ncbi:hypothetical protein PYW07_011592 [Mythimna separata]|uniref:THAP-type domain-containing protein n=1 Tax=Mythimna separata TaxID=271217 RepID=A0AAD7Y6P8_MYTSE|nr:hypothetical protein PYW07_011592 [Mythimna separata]